MSINRKDQAREAKAHRLYKATRPTNLVAPTTYTNAAMKAPYVPSAWPVRAGADSHFNHASRDSGAQIQRSATV